MFAVSSGYAQPMNNVLHVSLWWYLASKIGMFFTEQYPEVCYRIGRSWTQVSSAFTALIYTELRLHVAFNLLSQIIDSMEIVILLTFVVPKLCYVIQLCFRLILNYNNRNMVSLRVIDTTQQLVRKTTSRTTFSTVNILIILINI